MARFEGLFIAIGNTCIQSSGRNRRGSALFAIRVILPRVYIVYTNIQYAPETLMFENFQS